MKNMKHVILDYYCNNCEDYGCIWNKVNMLSKKKSKECKVYTFYQ